MNRSPLDDFHRELGGRFIEFGGWELPVSYDSVIAEHKAVRSDAGFFDVSHLGRFELTGPGSHQAIRHLLCNDIDRIEPGRTQYSMILGDDGGIIDDLIVWWWEPSRYWVMPNAANQERVMASFAAQPGCSVRSLREETVLLAVQGPRAPELLETIFEVPVARHAATEVRWEGSEVFMAGTGYTGERGGEVCLDPDSAHRLLDRLLEERVKPCGLGSRDTLRLEAGLPLWGQDIDETTTPFEAGLGFAVALDHDFAGRSHLLAQQEKGVDRLLIGLVLESRGIPRHGYPVRSGAASGSVTSGNLSPMLDKGVALAYLAPPPGTEDSSAEIEIRGQWLPATISKPPFHKVDPARSTGPS